MNLKFLPICKCGYVFKNFETYTELVQVNKNLHREIRHYEPNCCPNCKELIEGFTVPKECYGRIYIKE